MIYIRTRGRLGNQMFYYAFARSLQVENPNIGEIVFLPDNQTFDKYGGLPILDFNVNLKVLEEYPSICKKQKLIINLFRMIRRIFFHFKGNKGSCYFTIKCQHFLNKHGIYIGFYSEDVKIRHYHNNKNIMVFGEWENPIYFKDIRTCLLNEFSPRYDLLSHNKNLLDDIVSTNSVCVSIRRGDFLNKENTKFNICTEQYFYEAEKTIAKLLDSYKLFIFSDDVEWCRQNLHFKGQVSFEKNNGNDPVWEKMRLMSACKHFIISNSTFSWWAQYLSNYADKIVIAPRPWRQNEYCDCFYDDNFILLDGSTGKKMVQIWVLKIKYVIKFIILKI